VPSRDTFQSHFPDIDLPTVRRSDLPILVDQARKRAKFIKFMHVLNDTAGAPIDFENVSERIQELQGKLNTLAFQGEDESHLRDLFSAKVQREMMREVRRRRRGQVQGIPTGFKRVDRENMGLQKSKSVVVIGRTGIGKSWVDLIFMARAVIAGYSGILYPLEMSLSETAFRLYTIFSAEMFGGSRTIRNLDLQRGHVSPAKVAKLFALLEDKFAGQLMVADIGKLADPYTVERIEAEVEAHKPDIFWVDYITLLKPPPGAREEQGWQQVQKLSGGISSIAKRRNCVAGMSAQVNREALKQKVFLPRPEHISFGDSIAHDADMVFSINRQEDYLYYALVKNRGGMEIGKTRVRFQPNEGIARETAEQQEES